MRLLIGEFVLMQYQGQLFIYMWQADLCLPVIELEKDNCSFSFQYGLLMLGCLLMVIIFSSCK